MTSTLSAAAIEAALATARNRQTYPPAGKVRRVERDPEARKTWPAWQGGFWSLFWNSLDSRRRLLDRQGDGTCYHYECDAPAVRDAIHPDWWDHGPTPVCDSEDPEHHPAYVKRWDWYDRADQATLETVRADGGEDR